MSLDLINPIVTFLVGLVALAVYLLTKRNEKRNAAAIIVMDIRHAELVVMSILEKQVIDRSMKEILVDNNWAKYKHLFVSNFSNDDFAAFNRFFAACVDIADARRRMIEVFYTSLNAKATKSQELIFAIDDLSSDEGKAKRDKIIEQINTESYVFDPNEPKERILLSLQLIGRLSNTIAFEKLKNIAKIQ